MKQPRPSFAFVFVLGFVLAGVCLATPPVPVIPSQFNSTVHLEFFLDVLQSFNGTMTYDAVSGQSRFNLFYFFGGQKQYPLYSKLQFTQHSNYYTTNGVCRQWPGKWVPAFDWLEDDDTKYSGQTVVNGRTCDLWTNKGGKHGWVESLASIGNVPVQWNVTNTLFTYFQSLTYGTDFKPGPSPPSVFSLSDWCFNNGPICAGGTIANVTMIRFHSTDDWSIANHNVADLLGDTVFLCGTLGNDVHNVDQLITSFEVQVNTSWGAYGKCNNGNCRGGHNYTVGRAASAGVKKQGGQCDDNSDTGNWYSMPGAAECAPNQVVGGGEGGCAWKVLYRFKTITGGCLNQQGFSDACKASTKWPLSKPAQILLTALTSSDPQEGGCPGVPPPPSSSSLASVPSRSFPIPLQKQASAASVLEKLAKHPRLDLALALHGQMQL